MKKNLLKIYDIFKPNEKIKEIESFNDINKVTKGVLINKKKFHNYFNDYTKKTEVYSFKFPGITHYPLLQKKSCALLPIHKSKLDYYEDLKENQKNKEKEELSLLGKNKFIFSASKGDTFYKDKIKQNLRMAKNIFRSKLLNLEKAKLKGQKGQRYNSLFLDFFHKWNKDRDYTFDENSKIDININKDNNNDNKDDMSLYSNKSIYENNTVDYKHIINEKYSELKYDDNLIFNSNYTNFVNERLEFILLNDVENIETKLVSNFNDLNKNEIKLRLESIKINFKPIRTKISSMNNLPKKITLYIPLYFTFLFCIKDIDFFKYILLSCITFSENDKIIFDENLIKPALKAFFNQKNEEKEEPKPVMRNSGAINTMNKKNTTAFRRTATKAGISFRKSSVEKKGTSIGNANSKIFNLARNSILENNFSVNKKKKKEEIIHSNKKNINYFYSTKENIDNNNENKINSRKEINQYDEYIFIWETDDKTYLVNIQMPLIFFNFKNLKEEIATYCDKTLFLFMYKNNFINWDFYTLNYLFSIKVFRKRILQNYSLARKNILNNIFPKGNFKLKNSLEDDILKYMNKTNGKINQTSAIIKNDKFNLDEEISIINQDKNKIYNMVNPNNESYLFFYTNNSYENTLIKMYSYIIIIDYDKLNPKIRWKYILNFKLMKFLNEISKYEPLETFLPKITKTDFQNGRLSIDFSVFKEFNIKILGYEKKNLSNNEENNYINQRNKISGTQSNYTKENEDLFVDIKFPSFKEEKIVMQNNKILFKKTSTNIDINFLQELNKFKMDFWSKKILDIINKREKPHLFSVSDVRRNISDKKEKNIKKTNTNNNYENNINNNNDDTNNFNKNYIKSTSFTRSKFPNKNQ